MSEVDLRANKTQLESLTIKDIGNVKSYWKPMLMSNSVFFFHS